MLLIIKQCIVKLGKKWEDSPFFSFGVVFVLTFLAFYCPYINNPGIFAMDDHFFNFKYSYLVRTQGWDVVKNFDWIYLTKMAQEHTGWWSAFSLFQMALVPFTFIKDMILGLILGDIFQGSLSISLIYYALRKMEIKFPLFFVLVLLASNYFTTRIFSGRSLVLTTGLVFLEMYLAADKKYRKFFLISLIHVLWHPSTFFMPVAVVGVVEAARYISTYKIYAKNVCFSLLAVFLGTAFSLGSISVLWKYIQNLFSAFWGVKITNVGSGIEGGELYMKNPLDNFWSSNIFFLLTIFSIGVVMYYYIAAKQEAGDSEEANEKSSEYPDVLMYACFLFLLMVIFGSLIINGRFFDYYFVTTIALFGIVFTRLIREQKIRINQDVSKYIAAVIIVFFVFSAGTNLVNIRVAIARNDYKQIGEAATWIKARSNDKDLVFLQNWSWFPISFFYNSKNVYTVGMEPILLYEYNQKLYWKWYNMLKYNYYCDKEDDCLTEVQEANNSFKNMTEEQKNKYVKENGRKIVESIKNEFGAKFIISDSESFNKAILSNPDLIADSFKAESLVSPYQFEAFELK